eukprot:7282099-Prymnesium_polylepis.1
MHAVSVKRDLFAAHDFVARRHVQVVDFELKDRVRCAAQPQRSSLNWRISPAMEIDSAARIDS